jgi:hypothetical protein
MNNFMQGAGGSYPINLPQLDAGQLLAFLQSLDGKLNPGNCDPSCVPFSFARTLLRRFDVLGLAWKF